MNPPSPLASASPTRFNVVGVSGSGKSTFSAKLANQLALSHIQLDALYWGPNWSEADDPTFFAKLHEALASAGDRWVIDGNYTRTIPIKWKTVQTVVWIDHPFTLIFRQAFFRAIRRIRSAEELWPDTGNRETFRSTFLSRGSILLWTITSYRNVRENYRALMANPRHAGIDFVRLRGRKAAEAYLNSLASASQQP